MAYTAGFSVNVGDPTKASDVTTLAANDDYLKAAVDGKAALSGSTNNTVATVTGANALIGEADLTFASNKLTVFGTTGTGTATAGVLNLSTRETTVVDADQLGRIDFQAPAETGADAVLVTASIYAEADVTFDATNNATDIVFATAHDGAAAERLRITSQGEIGLAGANYGTDGQVLTSAGAGAAVAWESIPAGFSSGDAHTWTADQTFNDNVKVTLGTGGDADIYYNATDLIINPKVAGSGKLGIGNTTPTAHSDASGTSVVIGTGAADAHNDGLSIISGTTGKGRIAFGDGDGDPGEWMGVIQYQHAASASDEVMSFGVGGNAVHVGLTGAGRVGIGTVAPDGTLHVHTATCGTETANALGNVLVLEDDGNNGMSILTPDNAYGQILWGSPSGDGTGNSNARMAAGYNGGNQRLDFSVGQTDSLMTLVDTGYVGIGTVANNPFVPAVSFNGFEQYISNAHASGEGLMILLSGGAGDTSQAFLKAEDNSGSAKAIIWSNGTFNSATNTYTSVSDIKLKQDITDARSYWDDFKAVRFRKFKFKSDVAELGENAPPMLGVIAQELETIFPSLVYESPDTKGYDGPALDDDGNPKFEQTEKLDDDGNIVLDDDGNIVWVDDTEKPIRSIHNIGLGTNTKSAKYSILNQIGLCVIQELQTRLEAAEAEIAALKSA